MPQSSAEARERFGIDAKHAVIGFLGDIKPYKGLPVLLDAFAEIPPGRAILFIAGTFSAPEDYARNQRACISSLIEKGHRIVFVERRLNDADLSAAGRACDIVVLPYREVANSGFALFVLGLGGRIVTSDALGFLNLEAELGPYWVRPAREGAFHSAIVEAVSQTPSPHDEARMAAFREARSWLSIGRLTTEFYRRLRNGHRKPAMERDAA